MYTPPVPPVTMFRVFPVKSGAALALAPGAVVPLEVARGAWQAAATSNSAMVTERMRAPLISTSLFAGMLAMPRPALAADLCRGHPPLLLGALGHDRRERGGLPVVPDRDEHQIGRGHVDDRAGQQGLRVPADADLHALGAHIVHRRSRGHQAAPLDPRDEPAPVHARRDHPLAAGA